LAVTDVSAPQFLVRDVQLYERAVRLRMPFRFGVVTLTEAPQCFEDWLRVGLGDADVHRGHDNFE